MTVVEFFACAPIENMVSCFLLKPDKVIFIGGGRRAKRRMHAYGELARRKGINAVFEHRAVQGNSINSIADCLVDIVETEEECCFDLTGGDDLALVAMGLVYERYRGVKKLQMHRYNFNSRKMTDCDGDGFISKSMPFSELTVDENIALHGGTVAGGLRKDKLGERKDIEDLWTVCKAAPFDWNRNTAALSELICVARFSSDGLKVSIESEEAKRRFTDYEKRKNNALRFLSKLSKAGIVYNIVESKNHFSFFYKNSFVKKALSKSGNVLEYKMLSLASEAKDKNLSPLFTDCVGGVVIDWDGLIAGAGVSFGGTVNEVDLILMKGLIPVFVSCKNGGVAEEELYKLNTVAARFGNRYAKKVLVASGLNKKGQGLEYFKARAAEMGIVLVEKAHRMTDKELLEVLLKI